MSLIRWIAQAALRKLADEPEARPMRALPAPQSTALALRQNRQAEPPLLYATPVYREAPHAIAPAPPSMPAYYREPEALMPAPPRRRRKKVVVDEEIIVVKRRR